MRPALLHRVLLAAFILFPFAAFALYDPPPAAAIAAIEGNWQGALEYKDYQPPFKRVTLPTRIVVSASAPKEVAIHYVFNDGPNKTVHSYDRLLIDAENAVVKFSGLKADDVNTAAIVSSQVHDEVWDIVAERNEESKGVTTVIRYRLKLGKSQFEILKTSGPKGAEGEFRNAYVFKR